MSRYELGTVAQCPSLQYLPQTVAFLNWTYEKTAGKRPARETTTIAAINTLVDKDGILLAKIHSIEKSKN